MAEIRDLLYLDVGKASSLLSQADLGLVQEIRESEEGASDTKGTLGSGIPLLKAELSGSYTDRGSRSETRTLHHALLTRLEDVLAQRELLYDVVPGQSYGTDATALRERVVARPYVRAHGWVVFEDYSRMKARMEQFNTFAAFIRRCAQSTVEQSEDYRALKDGLSAQRRAAEQERDREKRRLALKQVQETESGLTQLVTQLVGTNAPTPIDEWLVQGIGHWIDTFQPGQIHLRVYPDERVPEFHLLANLKRTAFLDDSVDNLLFAYGPRPNVRLSLLGLITSAPAADGPPFDPMAEYSTSVDPPPEVDVRGFEQGFRQAFAGLQGLETFARFERYPNVTVYPIAVFREVAA